MERPKDYFRVLMNPDNNINANLIFGEEKNDHKILNAALHCQQMEKGRKVILVSKDINLRLKAKSLDIHAEDYETGKIKNLTELENTGKYVLEGIEPEIINRLYENHSVEAKLVLGTKNEKPTLFISSKATRIRHWLIITPKKINLKGLIKN
jgi:PhoH-like ATPase